MYNLLFDPFAADFMVRAALGIVALGIAGPLCGCWVTQRRLVYLTDAMSHAILAGVAAAAFFGVSLMVGAMAAALIMTVSVALLVARARIPEDSAIGITGQGLLALGVIGLTVVQDPRALTHVLFGNPLTVTWTDVVIELALASFVGIAGWMLFPLLVATTFDAVHARTVGVRVGLIDTLLLISLGLVVVIGLTTVGVLMAVVMIVAPATAARQLTTRMQTMMPLSVVLGVVAGLLGLLISYHAAVPSGPTIALIAVGEVVIAVAAAHLRASKLHSPMSF